MNKNFLLISLGHNSSAIFVDNSDPQQQEIIGYEQERLSGIKADSQFPRDAINEITKHVSSNKFRGCCVLISHWFNFGPHLTANKYITQNDIDWLRYICGSDIHMCERGFTHHDAHAYSAYEFFKYHRSNYDVKGPIMCLVVDGFGNNGEILSLYTTDEIKGISLVRRVYGYDASLGLMYQYATAFVGMKENQDEYKFLGYEAHIDEYVDKQQLDTIDHLIETQKEQLIKWFDTHSKEPEYYPSNEVIDFKLLNKVREDWNEVFTDVLKSIGFINTKTPEFPREECTNFAARCVIAYFIQQLCERTLVAWLNDNYNPENLIVAGGVFYNVKLNQVLCEKCAQKLFSVMPLAGDQGAAIGMYAKYCNRQFEFGNLCWGKRNFYNIEKLVKQKQDKNTRLVYAKIKSSVELENVQENIARLIADNNIVNLVIGNMEFGPRALCHTSTLFLPTSENIHCNNVMNGRNEVMPCAPVCTRDNAGELFTCDSRLDSVVGSDKYMICTHTYAKPYSNHYGGVMHKKPLEDSFTGRPQIVDISEFIYEVLDLVEQITDYKALVNTSFNVHGRPIAFDTISILQNYEYQCEHAVDGKEPYLFIIVTE